MVRTFGRVCEPGLFACVCGFVALSRSVCVRASYAMLTFATTLCYALVTPTIHPWVPERHTTVFANFLTPSLDPEMSSHAAQMSHAARSWSAPSKVPHQSSAKAKATTCCQVAAPISCHVGASPYHTFTHLT